MTALSRRLAEVLARPSGQPFRKDVIIIDGKGPSNWLTHGLIRAGGLGVQMNADLLSTWRLTPWLCSILRDEGPKEFPFDVLQGLTSKLYALLSADPGEWKDYVGSLEADGGTVLWDLCVRLTRHYKELLRNDADWIVRAENGAPDRWSRLWRSAIHGLRSDFSLTRSVAPDSPLHEADILIALSRPDNRAKVSARLPGRISFFSCGDVPRTHLKILDSLRDVLEVNVFLLQPTEGFLGDLKAYESDDGEEPERKSDRSASFRLLRSCGRHYRLQQEKVIDEVTADSEEFIPPVKRAPSTTLLGRIHAGVDAFHEPTAPLDRADASLSIHRCHGAWREAEVVRDQILAAFADPSLPGLRQGDVLILSPSPEIHAPLLAGVLGSRDPALEFCTAGMQGIRKSPVGNLVKALLELPVGRVTSLDVLGILGLDVVRDHTGWTDSELEDVEEWFRDAPFQWGLDAAHRQMVFLSAPETSLDSASVALGHLEGVSGESDENEADLTAGFDAGDSEGGVLAENEATGLSASSRRDDDVGTLGEFLRRLSLGTAFGGVPRIVAGALPLVGVDGQQALGLAAECQRVIGAIRDWAQFAQSEHDLGSWLDAFSAVTQALRPRSRQHLEEFAELSGALARMRHRVAQFADSPLSFRLFSHLAEEYCDFEAGVGQFMTGKVTLAPLRAASVHPARLVILMGMNDGAFPQRPPKAGPEVFINEKGSAPTLTRLRIEAREDTSMHAFLLAVLSAQDRLVVTFDGYVGSEAKPAGSALPIEILRASAQDCVTGGFSVRTHGLLPHHRPLPHGGSPDATVRDRVAVKVAKATESPTCKVLVPSLPKSAADFTFAEWLRFWESPPRHALRQLGVHIPWEKKVVPTSEPLQIDSDARRQAEKWVERCVSHEKQPSWEMASLTGYFPPAPEGQVLLEGLVRTEQEAEELMLAELAEHLSPDGKRPLAEAELIAGELVPFKTDEFRLFVHGNTVGVACLGYFSEGKHPYRWLMCLPAISAHVGRTLHRLFVTGVEPHSEEAITNAAEKGKVLQVKVKSNYLELPHDSLEVFRSKLLHVMDEVVDDEAPLMPVTFNAGVSQRFMGKAVRISDSNLRSSGSTPGDGKDARARLLIPEQFAFPAFASSITDLVPAEVRRLTDSKLRFARMTDAQQREIEAKERAERAAKALEAAERAAAKAAKAAAEQSGQAPPKKVVKPRRKKEDPS